MIYLDTSVALAHLLAEDCSPPDSLWAQPLISSRLLEYEMWNRVNTRRLGRSHGEVVRALISRVALIELAPPVLARALEPFPTPIRTLDALHLASIEFIRAHRQTVSLASYDNQLLAAARALGIATYEVSDPSTFRSRSRVMPSDGLQRPLRGKAVAPSPPYVAILFLHSDHQPVCSSYL